MDAAWSESSKTIDVVLAGSSCRWCRVWSRSRSHEVDECVSLRYLRDLFPVAIISRISSFAAVGCVCLFDVLVVNSTFTLGDGASSRGCTVMSK